MLAELYIEALLVDEELADLVWQAWDSGVINNDLAAIALLLLSAFLVEKRCRSAPETSTLGALLNNLV